MGGRLGGPEAAIAVLRKGTQAQPLYSAFEQTWVEPLLARGVAPANVFAGFRDYLAALPDDWPRPEPPPPDRFDSHPPLDERVRGIEAAAVSVMGSDRSPARNLLGDPDGAEQAISRRMLAAVTAEQLDTHDWDEIAESFARDIESGARAVLRVVGETLASDGPITPPEYFAAVSSGSARSLRDAVARLRLPFTDPRPGSDRLVAATALVILSHLASRDDITWRMTWIGSPTVVISNDVIDVWRLSRRLVGGDDATRDELNRLADTDL